MNKPLLLSALIALVSNSIYAVDSVTQPTKPAEPPTNASVPAVAPTTASAPAAATPAVIDCKYHISPQTTHIEETVISTWAGKASVQSFNFNPATLDQELNELKFCFTDAGWLGFNDALQKSGNINAIKTQNLTVSSQMDGTVKVVMVKDNQWKASVPLQVVYQNDKQKVTQLLDLDVLIGRKVSGDLGIMQMIATPRPTNTTKAPESTSSTASPATP